MMGKQIRRMEADDEKVEKLLIAYAGNIGFGTNGICFCRRDGRQ